MWSKEFWAQAAERAIKTAAQVLLSLIGVEMVAINALDWQHIAAVTATAFVASVITSIADPSIPLTTADPTIVKSGPKHRAE